MLRNKRGHDSERPAHRDEEWPPLAATRESPTEKRRPNIAINQSINQSINLKKKSPLYDSISARTIPARGAHTCAVLVTPWVAQWVRASPFLGWMSSFLSLSTLGSRFILEVELPGVADCFHCGGWGGEGKRGIMEDA